MSLEGGCEAYTRVIPAEMDIPYVSFVHADTKQGGGHGTLAGNSWGGYVYGLHVACFHAIGLVCLNGLGQVGIMQSAFFGIDWHLSILATNEPLPVLLPCI